MFVGPVAPIRLEGWVRASAVRSGLARRARIVLCAAEGLGNTAVPHLLRHGRGEVVGQLAGDVSQLVHLPALDHRVVKHGRDAGM